MKGSSLRGSPELIQDLGLLLPRYRTAVFEARAFNTTDGPKATYWDALDRTAGHGGMKG